jgi:DNA-directed RNA polymerase subunit M/transcription elongation factor TFIIS
MDEIVCSQAGGTPCDRCASTRTYTMNMQTRSCDEGTTVFVMCYSCKSVRKIKG